MKKKIRYVMLGVFTLLLALSLYKIIYYGKDYFFGQSEYREARELFSVSDDIDPEDLEYPGTYTEDSRFQEIRHYFSNCDFSSLRTINSEIYAWIVIPGTNISYPICQHSDNDYYLMHTYSMEENRIGAIFLDYRVSNDFSDYNTVIFGHRLRDQTMFSALKTYREKDTWEKNPYIFICTPDDTIRVYKIYSAFAGDPDGISYNKKIKTDSDKQKFIDYTLRCAEYKTDIEPTIDDKFITLSTCIGTNHTHRMIIHAVYDSSISLY